jgi:hypothetical protein
MNRGRGEKTKFHGEGGYGFQTDIPPPPHKLNVESWQGREKFNLEGGLCFSDQNLHFPGDFNLIKSKVGSFFIYYRYLIISALFLIWSIYSSCAPDSALSMMLCGIQPCTQCTCI